MAGAEGVELWIDSFLTPMLLSNTPVCIVNRLRVGRSGFEFRQWQEFFLSSKRRPDRSGFHPISCSVDPGVLSLELKWPELDVDHLFLSSADVKIEWSCTSIPFMT